VSAEPGQYDLLITGGRLVGSDGVVPGSIAVQDAQIAALLEPGVEVPAKHIVDASGLMVLPGLIDMHVHFRDPGHPHKETFQTGSAAAAAGGFTSVADMPNTVPPTTSAERLAAKRALGEGRSHVDFALWGGAGSVRRVTELARAGAIGVKVYLGLETASGAHADAPSELHVADDAVLQDILEEAAENDVLVAVHCGNEALRSRTRARWRGSGFDRLKAEITSEPQLHKVEAVSRTLLLAEYTGARVHIVHVPAPALPIIRTARERGVNVSVEAALPFVTHDRLDEFAELGFDRYRSPEDARLLWQGAADGTIDVLATDHAPHTLEEKRRGREDLLASPSGYPELDTALPMLLDAVNRGLLTLERLVCLMGAQPARILRLADKGALRIGCDADLTLVDMDREDVIERGRLRSRAGWSPFEGRRVIGWPVRTFLRGAEIAYDGRLTGSAPIGRFLAGRGSLAPG
jgi:dihydroorotase